MVSADWERPPQTIAKYYLYQATATYGFFWPGLPSSCSGVALRTPRSGSWAASPRASWSSASFRPATSATASAAGTASLLGSVLLAASLLGFVVAQTFAAFVALFVLWGLGVAFRSGSGDAWLYETLEERLDESQFTRVRGHGGAVNQWVTAVSMLAAGVLYSHAPRLPFVAGGELLAGSVPVLLSMPQTDHHTEVDTVTVLDALPVVRRQLSRPPLRSTVAYLALFFGVTSAVDEYIQPVAVGAVGVSESGLGSMYAGFTVVAAVTSYNAGDVERLLSTQWAVVLVPAAVALALLVPLVAPAAALPAFFLVKSARTAVAPIAKCYINDHVDAVGRATVLSAASMAYALVRLPLKPLSGAVADATTPLATFAAFSALLLVGGALVFAWERPASTADPDATPTE